MLEFNVNNQIITRKDNFKVVADSRDYLQAVFTMSDEWSGAVVAVFCGGDEVYHCNVSDGTCKVPHEVIKAPGFSVSLFCSDNRLVTANVVWVDVLPSGYREGTEPSPPSPQLWQQYMERMSLMIESGLPYIGDDYCWYLFNPEKGDYECTGIKAKAETPVKGRDYWTEEDKTEMVEAVLDSIPDENNVFKVGFATNGPYHRCNRTNAEIVEAMHQSRNIIATYNMSGGSENEYVWSMIYYGTEKKYALGNGFAALVDCAEFKFFSGSDITEIKFDPTTEQWAVNGSQPIVPPKVEIVQDVLAALPDADAMEFPLENSVSEVTEG